LKETIEGDRPRLESIVSEVGITSVNGEDDAFVFEDRRAAERLGIERLQALVVGDEVRDYRINAPVWAVWPYGPTFEVLLLASMPDVASYLWRHRALISPKRFGTRCLSVVWPSTVQRLTHQTTASLTITFGKSPVIITKFPARVAGC
jgi:hypothetical protein